MEASPVSVPLRYLVVAVLAPLIVAAPFAALVVFAPESLHRARDVLAGICVAAIGFALARRFTR